LSAGVWTPGVRHPLYSHVTAAQTEGYWDADPGYTFSITDSLASAIWTPGRPSPSYANLVAGADEGRWVPAQGYRFANTDPNDFTVIASDDGSSGFDKFMRVAVPVVAAIVANSYAQPQSNDSAFQRGFIRPAAAAVRDESVKEAIRQAQ
jgi:hypothetical protein